MKKNNLLGCLCMGLYLVSCTPAYEVELSTQYAAIRLNQEGYICEIVDNRTGKNYIPEHDFPPLLALYTGKGYINPIQYCNIKK